MLDLEIRRHRADSPWTYSLLDRRQREIQSAILNEGARGKILLSEVAPVVTLGRNFHRAGMLASEATLRTAGVDLFQADRGGRATYHGTGQWVLFVVERLDRLVGDPRGVKNAFQCLEQLTWRVTSEWCRGAEIRKGEWSGIWSAPGPRGKKLASFGIKVDRGVLLHGVCVNGFETPESFSGIDPCGLPAKPGFLMTSPDQSEFLRIGERLVQETVQRFPERRFLVC